MAGPEVVVVDDSSDEDEVEEPPPPLNLKDAGGVEARMQRALTQTFRLRAFRQPQQEVVKHVLQGGSGLVLVRKPAGWMINVVLGRPIRALTPHTRTHTYNTAPDGRGQVAVLPAPRRPPRGGLFGGESPRGVDGGPSAGAAGQGHRRALH